MRLGQTRRSFINRGVAVLAATVLSSAILIAASSKKYVIEIKFFQFSKPKLNVKVGDTIEWVNKDIAPHTATAKDLSWNTGLISLSESAVISIEENMHEQYFCEYHPAMTAQIKITS